MYGACVCVCGRHCVCLCVLTGDEKRASVQLSEGVGAPRVTGSRGQQKQLGRARGPGVLLGHLVPVRTLSPVPALRWLWRTQLDLSFYLTSDSLPFFLCLSLSLSLSILMSHFLSLSFFLSLSLSLSISL